MYYRLSVVALILKICGPPIIAGVLRIRIHLRWLVCMIRRSRRLRIVVEGVGITAEGVGIAGGIMGEFKILSNRAH